MKGCPSCATISRRRLFDGLTGWAALAALAEHAGSQVISGSVTPRGSAKACVFINMDGAPSHLDTFDVKDAPWNPPDARIRQAGSILLSQTLFPQLSRFAADLCVLRSVSSWEAAHDRAQFYIQTGHPSNPAFAQETPHIGAVVGFERGGQGRLPPFLSLNAQSGQGAAFLGGRYEPLSPSVQFGGFSNLRHCCSAGMNPDTFNQKYKLLRELEAGLGETPADPRMAAHGAIYESARQLMHDESLEAVFRFAEDDARRYGNTPFGNACVLARNAIRSGEGAAFIMIRNEGWDTHVGMFDRGYPGNMYQLSNTLDAGVAALIEDLKASGHFDETLIVMMGEFGRTPGALNNRGGRDHHRNAMSVVMAGGGTRAGRVIGATDANGDKIIDPGWSRGRPIYIEDIICTIYSALGINWTKRISNTPSGRIYEYVASALYDVYGPVTEVFA